jgi:hypothetical protein
MNEWDHGFKYIWYISVAISLLATSFIWNSFKKQSPFCSTRIKCLLRLLWGKRDYRNSSLTHIFYTSVDLYLNVPTMNSWMKRNIAFWVIKWYHLFSRTTSRFSPLQEYLHCPWWCILCCLMNWIITIVARPSWTSPKFSYLHKCVNNA